MNILTDRVLPTPRVVSHSFTETVWAEVLGHLAQVIGPEASRYAAVPAAKLLASISYLAGSEDPDRFAVSNLLTFHGATKARDLFNHRATDDNDVLRRLATLHFGNVADAETVACGLKLLALISLNDHESDQEADLQVGKYNPVGAGQWNAASLRGELSLEIARNPNLKGRFDEAVGMDVGTLSFWTT